MKVIPYLKNTKIFNNNCIFFGIYEDENILELFKEININNEENIKKVFEINNWKDNFGKFITLYNFFNFSYDRIVFINLGLKKKKKINFVKIFKKIFIFSKENNVKNIYINISNSVLFLNNLYWNIRNLIDSFYNVYYNFNVYKKEIKKNLKKIFIKIKNKKDFYLFNKSVKHSLSISKSIKLTKNISNLPPNICNPKYLIKCAKKLSKKYSNFIKIDIINEKYMKKLNMNAFLSVSKGSKNKSYIAIMHYKNPNYILNNQPFILIGKGVTFDSGGISIKPSYLMDEMKYDMCGASSVIGIIDSISSLNLPLNVIGILASCENMPDGNSFRPGDVIKTMSGKTVEILNTDAEGRLILCDILTYVERFKPKVVIDIATLTGSCVSTLGNAASGLFSNNKILLKEIINASKNIDDKVWSLPNFKVYKKSLKSNFADLSNIGGKNSGASTASYFLSYFAKKYKWAHLDIAGTAWNNGNKKGSTGKPVKLLLQYFLNFIKKNK
ncbi:MAG: leucyl aminopeptidase [Buchnera aphidicola (Periphyllus lyropictus)]|uniref:leucyl aminopeptidase n=1 Tax=Buchnera aphidicola TaxID=9 RepID=UPI001EC503A7|nr:leucyl aminopeptidase [Buchnera aphidicola]NIH16583.1 leucyl aminopeptidase [Buchnera aphidicola (Periphyllus lyropictus)]USS94473.1 leucyl aminopeptidase [Buchnera aphidicola (Periphyllus lyropictus)]